VSFSGCQYRLLFAHLALAKPLFFGGLAVAGVYYLGYEATPNFPPYVSSVLSPCICEGYMHQAQESSARKLARVEAQGVVGWGCSECAWVFKPSGAPTGKSFDEVTRYFQAQLYEQFASHACAEHPRVKAATA